MIPLRVLSLAGLVLLAGCSWPQWATIDYDPLAFLADGDKAAEPAKPVDPATASAEVAAAVPVDQLASAGALSPQPGGSPGSFGLNLDLYLSEDTPNIDERIARLERVVAAMHRDMKTLIPTIQKSSQKSTSVPPRTPAADAAPIPLTVQPDLNEEDEVEPEAPVLAQAPQATTPQVPVAPGSQPVSGGGLVVTGVRVGEHPGMVRLVFDVSAGTTFKADLDNGEGLLVVELPGVQWQAPVSKESFGKTPVVKSYKVDGSLFVLELKGATEILKQQKIPALSGSGERIVIDLKA